MSEYRWLERIEALWDLIRWPLSRKKRVVTSQEEQVDATQEAKSNVEMPKTEVRPARGSALDALMSNVRDFDKVHES